jgi:hypothetical protein
MLRSFLAETDNTTFDHVERRRRLIDGSGGVPALLTAACAKLSDDCRAGNADVDHVLETWLGGSRLRPVDAGLPDDLVSVLPMIDDVESEDVSSLLELIREGWSSESPAPDMTTVLRFFADVGLIVAGDPMREGVRLTPFGRLLQRSAET